MRAARLLALTIAAQLTAAVAATAAPPHAGDFDRSFGQKGRVKLSLPGERFVPSALVVQPDRKIVVAGTLVGDPASYPGSFAGRPAAIRFEPNGALDTGFGEAGLARMDAPQPTAIQGLAVQPDGALLLSGLTLPEDGVWIGAVVRLLPSGEVDDGFGSGGFARLPASSLAGYPPGVESVTQLAVQPDGRIVAAGSQDPYDVHSTADPYVARLMPDGRLDQSFGKDGRASFGPENPIAALARPSGDVVVVGSNSYHLGGSALSLLRVDPAGNDFPLPGHPTDAWVEHRYEAELVGVAASARPDGTIDFVG
ncbi:MAG TPA: hypothetical protein VJT68_08935, partial [Thermoleophilaceae bacterium]|nr:hypothetical protein [Thermoleophilaceae bacterium]